jgi:hypothetical protein
MNKLLNITNDIWLDVMCKWLKVSSVAQFDTAIVNFEFRLWYFTITKSRGFVVWSTMNETKFSRDIYTLNYYHWLFMRKIKFTNLYLHGGLLREFDFRLGTREIMRKNLLFVSTTVQFFTVTSVIIDTFPLGCENVLVEIINKCLNITNLNISVKIDLLTINEIIFRQIFALTISESCDITQNELHYLIDVCRTVKILSISIDISKNTFDNIIKLVQNNCLLNTLIVQFTGNTTELLSDLFFPSLTSCALLSNVQFTFSSIRDVKIAFRPISNFLFLAKNLKHFSAQYSSFKPFIKFELNETVKKVNCKINDWFHCSKIDFIDFFKVHGNFKSISLHKCPVDDDLIDIILIKNPAVVCLQLLMCGTSYTLCKMKEMLSNCNQLSYLALTGAAIDITKKTLKKPKISICVN